ncbi:DNA excision repair protein [Wickerhamomyces ciferrii]|uniref:DNA helicase n=1 Tax=Wickerhamomyces ciferrii (strain ATCC 14091 / BCRC 22168 / CBS 111 / JCM 3599 / NBRC 0793 / NRRL Y-1031 F-60-10) TaxID=1206466 RepID=K0KBU3_WICCF|nr:DNA excision repair protein [Wickerhamomyces ciferrii]CCH42535.1 DNA excision repair protein [Wickerhamomyces ciferrii]
MSEGSTHSANEATTDNSLQDLGIRLVEQSSLEHKIQANANKMITEKEIESDIKRFEKSKQQLNKINFELRKLHDRLNNPRTKISQKEELRKHIKEMTETQLKPTESDIIDIEKRLRNNKAVAESTGVSTEDGGRLPNETEKDFLIRTGKITAFGNTAGFVVDEDKDHIAPHEVVSHQNLRIPGFSQVNEGDSIESDDSNEEDVYKRKRKYESDNEYNSEEEDDAAEDDGDSKKPKLLTEDDIRNTDDGIESFYQDRLNTWVYRRSQLRKGSKDNTDQDKEEWFKPHPSLPDAILNSDFKVSGDIYPSLFDYQKTGVQWLYELYQQKHGGIISDEMGLGKTIQIISFLAGLHYSGKLDKPILVVCPATVMTQWVNEFHTWWPPFRTMVLHSIGTGMSKNSVKEEDYEKLLLKEGDEVMDEDSSLRSIKKNSNVNAIMDTLLTKGHVVITSYVGLRIYEEQLLNVDWGYAVLDEGHKIKNPNSNITILSKRLKTYNRIILSGTPIQNNLVELWSLFDFIFPGRLGTLPIFQDEFETPIKVGGYANASNLDVKIGYQKAVILKELIQPFLLRRVKMDVARDLPSKQEFVLMCRLTQYQKEKYLEFLRSFEIKIHSYLGAIDLLRKICNHPDLADIHYMEGQKGYGDPAKSGKLQVVKSLLTQWKQEGHKVLLFTQTKQMMVILEKFLKNSFKDYRYMKMSGETGIGKRQDMIYSFNNEGYDLFLLTTKVGGLGVNLTGADRVIIFDPDWNPSTDLQARERAWRLGQKKEVLIYRLIIGGSIEEKIYHRQIFKQLLTDKILKDPNQKRFFKNSELHDLFTLSDFDDNSETGNLFKDTRRRKNQDDLAKIQDINAVTKIEKFKDNSQKETEDERLLSGLFKNTGAVTQAIKHDDIVKTHSRPKDDLLEREARKSANEALEALKKSRKQVKRAGLGVPTFTGKFGLAGRTASPALGNRSRVGSPSPFGGNSKQSSSSILSNIKKNKEANATQSSHGSELNKNSKIIDEMRNFLANRDDNFAKSGEILDAVSLEIVDKKDLTLVRSMLKGIANWDASKSGWTLKGEFK